MTRRDYRRRLDVVQRRLGEDVVLLLPADEATVLEGGSAAVWDAVGGGPVAVEDVCARLLERHGETVEQAVVQAMLEELLVLGALESR